MDLNIALLIRNIVLMIVLGWITYTDLKRHEIDFEPLIVGLIFIIPFSLLGFNNVSFVSSLIGMVVSFCLFFIFSFFGMGGGDMKLIAVIGLFLGWQQILVTMFLSFYIGAFFAIMVLLFKKGRNKLKMKVPFGPSIAIGTFITLFYGNDLINLFLKYCTVTITPM